MLYKYSFTDYTSVLLAEHLPDILIESTQLIKAVAAKTDDLSSIPGPTWWKQRTDSHKKSSDFYICAFGMFMPPTAINQRSKCN